MTHSIETCKRVADHPKSGLSGWWCPVCRKTAYGGKPAGECPGPTPALKIVENLACIHRLEKVGTVPCGVCTKNSVRAVVYGCRANGGQNCTLYAIGTGTEQYVDGKLPEVCITCKIREAPANTEG